MTSDKADRVTPPEFGAPTAPCHPSRQARELLALRRSTSADLLTSPGPDEGVLAAILEIAARVPDHRRLYPFRFIIFRGDGRVRAGEILANRFTEIEPGAPSDRAEAERRRFLRAPVVICVVSHATPSHKTPVWEQVLTSGAVCLNLLLAASAYGFAGAWITEWYAYDPAVVAAFGLNTDERIAGFVYLGTAVENPRERQRPNMSDLVSEF